MRRDIDVEYLKRAKAFMGRSVAAGKPFFLYFNHSMMHLPTIPRAEFKGRTGHGDWADCLLQLDADFGALLDELNSLGVADNTIVVFSGDNGPEEAEPWRGTAGYFESIGLPAFLAYVVFGMEAVGGVLLVLGVRTREVSAALIPILIGALWAHSGNGWVFSNEGGGWEYPLYLIVLSAAQVLLGEGAWALGKSREAHGRLIAGQSPA